MTRHISFVRVWDLEEGMEIGEDLYIQDVLILSKDLKLTNKDIEKLRYFKIDKIKIKWYEKNNNEFQKMLFIDTIDNTKKIFEHVIVDEKIDLEKVEEMIESILEEALMKDGFLKAMNHLKDKDEYTYFHSVETSVYSVIVGKKLNLCKEDLKKLGIGSILHDIGKMKVPKEILLKPEKLSEEEFEEMKKHPFYGEEILAASGIEDQDILDIVCQHHEKLDGSGYPKGLKGKEINKLAQIVAISDIYDALTTDRVYRQKLKKYEAIEYLYCLADHQLDIDIVRSFCMSIKVYPIGCKVTLNTGEIGEVTQLHENYPLRPILKIVCSDKRGGEIVDLIQEHTLLIEKIVE